MAVNGNNILKKRYGIIREENVIQTPQIETLFVVQDEKELSEEFLEKSPNIMTKKRIKELAEVPELVCPEIPMLINTIENCYGRIAVYGRSDYAKKIYSYLRGNSHISLLWIEEEDFKYQISKKGGIF